MLNSTQMCALVCIVILEGRKRIIKLLGDSACYWEMLCALNQVKPHISITPVQFMESDNSVRTE